MWHVWEEVRFIFIECFNFISSWLRDNEAEATERYNTSLPRREDLDRLKKELCHDFDLADIR